MTPKEYEHLTHIGQHFTNKLSQARRVYNARKASDLPPEDYLDGKITAYSEIITELEKARGLSFKTNALNKAITEDSRGYIIQHCTPEEQVGLRESGYVLEEVTIESTEAPEMAKHWPYFKVRLGGQS